MHWISRRIRRSSTTRSSSAIDPVETALAVLFVEVDEPRLRLPAHPGGRVVVEEQLTVQRDAPGELERRAEHEQIDARWKIDFPGRGRIRTHHAATSVSELGRAVPVARLPCRNAKRAPARRRHSISAVRSSGRGAASIAPSLAPWRAARNESGVRA